MVQTVYIGSRLKCVGRKLIFLISEDVFAKWCSYLSDCGIPPSGLKCNGCSQFFSYTQAVVFSTIKYAKLDNMNSNCISILVENLNWETSPTPQYIGFKLGHIMLA